MTADDPTIVADARHLVQGAAEREITVCLIGGVAIWARANAGTRAALGRDYGDFDLVAHRQGSRALRKFMEELGFLPQTVFNATHGDRRLLYHHPDGTYHVDVFLDQFEMSHKLDLGARLDVEPLTLPAADLLLTKLQVAEINAKDLSDAAMLLLDHEPGPTDGAGCLNLSHIAAVGGADWGLHTTLSDNLVLLERALPTLALTDEDRQTVQQRASRVAQCLIDAPKTSRWKMRARVGRRVRWYETPEEVGQ
jgi:hypothetical protein